MTPAIIIDRLKWHYQHRTPLPEADDNMDESRTLNLNQLQRLMRAVVGEFVEA